MNGIGSLPKLSAADLLGIEKNCKTIAYNPFISYAKLEDDTWTTLDNAMQNSLGITMIIEGKDIESNIVFIYLKSLGYTFIADINIKGFKAVKNV